MATIAENAPYIQTPQQVQIYEACIEWINDHYSQNKAAVSMRQPLCFEICFAIYSPSENMELAREVTKDSSTLKISAHQKPSTTILSIK